MTTLYETINNLYSNQSYLGRYGLDVYLTIIIVVFFIGIILYLNILNSVKSIRADWIRQRCSPTVIPYAGVVYRKPGQSIIDATNENFAFCTQNILKNLSNYALLPYTYIVNTIILIFSSLIQILSDIRAMLNNIRNSVKNVSQDTMGRALNVMAPIQQVVVSMKSIFDKAAGVGSTAIYTLLGMYLSLKSLIGSIIELIIIFLVAFLASIIPLWFFPWTVPLAALLTGVFIFIAIICAIIIIAFSQTFKGKPKRKIPKAK